MIIVHTTKEQVLDWIDVLVPFGYKADGTKTRSVPAWMLVLLYMSTPVTRDDVDATDTLLQGN